MKIVIIGDGKVDFAIAKQLSQEGYDITIIENKPQISNLIIAVLDVVENRKMIYQLWCIKKVQVKPDIIILDPPRSGVSPKALDYVIKFNAKEIIYVSCNPKTMVDNLETLLAAGYKVEKSTVKDMFPNTPHAETVVKLTKTV